VSESAAGCPEERECGDYHNGCHASHLGLLDVGSSIRP
jgi:hypothetical protein